MEPFIQKASALIEASIAKNTWVTYENAVVSFQKFRRQYGLELSWPPPVFQLANYLAYLAYESYSPATARSYISGISFSLKYNALYDTTQAFIIQKMLKGMNRLYGRSDLRLPITVDMMKNFLVLLFMYVIPDMKL